MSESHIDSGKFGYCLFVTIEGDLTNSHIASFLGCINEVLVFEHAYRSSHLQVVTWSVDDSEIVLLVS